MLTRIPLIILFLQLFKEAIRDVKWFCLGKFAQLNAIQLCPPVIYTLQSDYNFLSRVKSFICWSYEGLLALILAWALRVSGLKSLRSCIKVYLPLHLDC